MKCKCIGAPAKSSSGSERIMAQAVNKPLETKANPKHDTSKQAVDIYGKQIHASKSHESALEELQLSDRQFDAQVISDMLSTGKLVIDNLMDLATLIIKLPHGQRSLEPHEKVEFVKYLNALVFELEEFRNHPERRINAPCHTLMHDNHGRINMLRISLPNQALYMQFIKQLADKQMMSIQTIHQHETKPHYNYGDNHFNPTPFSNRLTMDPKHTPRLRPKKPTEIR